MSRLIAVKIGNTTASAALASDGALGDVLRVPVGRLENLKEILTCAASSGGARLAEEGAAVIVASVNPRALAHLRGIAVDATGAEPEVAGEDFPIPIRADVEEPERVGTDRLLAALAARGRLGSPCVVVDLGTAVTVDAVAADGAFAGGAIFPGLEMSADALARGTALLPKISLPTDAPRIGRSTAEAIS
ncbi:MAG: type III pantothenate kinase, partial [Phycisphaerae bacterium]